MAKGMGARGRGWRTRGYRGTQHGQHGHTAQHSAHTHDVERMQTNKKERLLVLWCYWEEGWRGAGPGVGEAEGVEPLAPGGMYGVAHTRKYGSVMDMDVTQIRDVQRSDHTFEVNHAFNRPT